MLGEKELVQKNIEKLVYYVDCMRNELLRWRNEVSDEVLLVIETIVGNDVVEKLRNPYKLNLVKLFGVTASVVMGLDRELIERFEELQDKVGDDIGYIEDVNFYCKEIFETLMVVQFMYQRYGEWVGEIMEIMG